ncbi:NADH-quinone oxidoreductase subunit NuoF [Tautonia plasticadhaerens]|uniref:NADH-quinone oxidoreductase subunit F n=1 Tax=Tautonia plasticadhaerens TaxID=2527974 RepID=A0A518H8H7_9BACT|nr:NADH-quinone oxidoreductase subunit NuoF [Tautonia plasticadhaerens]QDV37153.1 NADH-quinone oxidoreductase subunit F [Tautonia plasticadhaerens]
MAAFEPVLTRNFDVENSQSLKVYESRGGYQSARKALATMTPDEVVQLVKESELRGRGGAGFPTGLKWTFLPKERKETFMCVNGDESEPATFNNRYLLERDPHQMIEGILISCFATRASTAYLYNRFEYITATRIMEKAIAEAREAGILGKNIFGSGFDLEIYVHRGAGAYICGEETGLIESLEGKRGWPRIKPPFPAVEGAFRKPTVVNNIETLCCVPHIVERGVDWFKSMGLPKSYGPKLYTISGHVNDQVCVELPLGVTTRQLIEDHGRGVWKGRKAKAAVPGGISMGLLSADELDVPLDFEEIRKTGCLGLGTAAVTVIDDQTPIMDVLHNTCRFFAHESCGQCTPCREGTTWFYKTMTRIKAGGGRLQDLDVMEQLARNMGITPGTTICGLADGAAWPIKNAMAKFRPELEEYIRTHQKADQRPTALQEAIYRGISPSRFDTSLPEPTESLPGLTAPGHNPRTTPGA